MSGNTPTLKNKVSPHIQSQLPEFVQTDHPLFSLFLKYYYEFLEAGELVVTGTNNYVIEETITQNYILDEDGLRLVLEDSVGKFSVGETITGALSGATARILVDDFDANNRFFITSQQRFQTGETITGQSSGATTTVSSYRANPVQNIQQLLAYADVDNTVYDFLDKFRDSFMESLPNTLADGIAKRKLIKNIRDMYAAKGTENGHKLFFRILFNEEATIIYPRDSLLRPSDGQWSTDKIIRIVENGLSDFNNAIGKTITGSTSGATALISTVIKFREGSILIAELNLDANSVTGTFVEGEIVTTTDTILDLQISGIAKSIVIGGQVLPRLGGAYYQTGDSVTITGGDGNDAATARVESAGSGSIDEIIIENGGSGYSIGEELQFNITNTEGKDVRARIDVVGGGIHLEPDTAPDHITSEDGDLFITDDDIKYLQQEETVGDLDFLVMEDGGQIILEEETFNNLSVSSEIGQITKITMINRGNGFLKLPLVSDSATSTGTGSSLFAASTIYPTVGHVEGISITNFGLDYTSSPTITLNRNLLVKNISGSFIAGDTLTSHTATVVDFDADRNILELQTAVAFNRGDTITTVTGTTATVQQNSYAQSVATIGTVGTTIGSFVSDRGKVSVDTMKIQDSYYYQDYSYVVRVGQSINEWRESVRRSVHPAGWNVFGEVSFASLVSARIHNPTAGNVGDYIGDDTFSPELASTFANLFTTVFGRRLGTVLDGTTQRVSAKVGVVSPSELASGTRDVTLTSDVSVRMNVGRGARFLGGPTLENFTKYAFTVSPVYDANTFPNAVDAGGRVITTSNNYSRDQYTIAQFGYLGIRDVCLENGSIPTSVYTIRINVPPPSEIIISRGGLINTFDNDFIKFDDGIQKFDEGTGGAYDVDTEGRYASSFDQASTYFDNDTFTMDAASGNEQDYELKTFDENDVTFDGQEHTFDSSSTDGQIPLLFSRLGDYTFDSTATTWNSEYGTLMTSFDSLGDSFDETTNTFDKNV